MEDKYEICRKLQELVKMTRAGAGIEKLEYLKIAYDDENVWITFKDGSGVKINVGADTGLAMVRDVLKSL